MYSGYAAEMLADSVIALYMSLMLVRMRTGLRRCVLSPCYLLPVLSDLY